MELLSALCCSAEENTKLCQQPSVRSPFLPLLMKSNSGLFGAWPGTILLSSPVPLLPFTLQSHSSVCKSSCSQRLSAGMSKGLQGLLPILEVFLQLWMDLRVPVPKEELSCYSISPWHPQYWPFCSAADGFWCRRGLGGPLYVWISDSGILGFSAGWESPNEAETAVPWLKEDHRIPWFE